MLASASEGARTLITAATDFGALLSPFPISITLDSYSAVLPNMQRDSVERLAQSIHP